MMQRHLCGLFALAALEACIIQQAPGEDPSPPQDEYPRYVTPHFEFFGDIEWRAAQFYETYASELEAKLDIDIAPMQFYQSFWPEECRPPHCVLDGGLTVACRDSQLDCMPAVSSAIVTQLGPMPLILKDGLTDVLAGGIGHGDALDIAIPHDLDIASLLEDERYLPTKITSGSTNLDELTWRATTLYPAADFVRYVLDHLSPRGALLALADPHRSNVWESFLSFEHAVASWRETAPRQGRMHRIPLAECSQAFAMPLGNYALPVSYQGVIYAPDIVSSISRFGVGNFSLDTDSVVSITVRSEAAGSPFYRVESCGDGDPGAFANMFTNIRDHSITGTANLSKGRYFLIAGSWTNHVGYDTESVQLELSPH